MTFISSTVFVPFPYSSFDFFFLFRQFVIRMGHMLDQYQGQSVRYKTILCCSQ